MHGLQDQPACWIDGANQRSQQRARIGLEQSKIEHHPIKRAQPQRIGHELVVAQHFITPCTSRPRGGDQRRHGIDTHRLDSINA
jgi:hypothetical protein